MDKESQLIQCQCIQMQDQKHQQVGSPVDQIQIGSRQQVEQFLEMSNKNSFTEQDRNLELMKRIISEREQEEKKRQREARDFKKRMSQLKKTQSQQKIQQNKQQQANRKLKQKQQRIFKSIQPSIKRYRQLHYSNKDNQVQRLRSENVLKVFTYLLYGIKQVGEIQPQNLTQQEKVIKSLNSLNSYNLCKQLAAEIDRDLINIANKGNRSIVSKSYKVQWKNIVNNIQDLENYGLRKKIILGIYTPKMLATIDELQLYNDKKRQKVKEKRMRILQQSVKIEKTEPIIAQENQIEHIEESKVPFKQQTKQNKGYRYIDQSTVFQLSSLTSQQFLSRVKKFLEESLEQKEELKNRLVNHFVQVFPRISQK